jgi:flagellar export protein FliJ
MAKGLDGMIRLHKWQLDEKRRQMTDLERMKDDLLQKKNKMAAALIAEQQNISDTNVVNINYANYAASIMERQENLDKSIEEIDVSIEDMKDELSEAFNELKKYETVQERKAERARVKQARKDQIALDEISAQMHRRQRELHEKKRHA